MTKQYGSHHDAHIATIRAMGGVITQVTTPHQATRIYIDASAVVSQVSGPLRIRVTRWNAAADTWPNCFTAEVSPDGKIEITHQDQK